MSMPISFYSIRLDKECFVVSIDTIVYFKFTIYYNSLFLKKEINVFVGL